MSKVEISIIIPCYNEGSTFENNVELILRELKKIKASWEIIFVEDKSRDDTKASVEKFIKKVKNSGAIFHRKNEGRGESVKDGIIHSRGSICGFMDVDCEVSPTFIPMFISEIQAGFDMAVAVRYYEFKFSSISRFLASKGYSFIVSQLLNLPIKDTEAGFKFFNRRKILPILKEVRDKRWFWDTEICARAHMNNLNISEVPVIFNKRDDKKSTVRLVPDSIEYLKRILEFRSLLKKEGKVG